MTKTFTLYRSFAGGEVSPEFFGQVEDVKYQTGLATARNVIIKPHGPAANRAGTRFVRACKYNDRKAFMIPFTFSNEQTAALEFGDGYVRFHTQGATLGPGTPAAWSNSTPYVIGSLVSSGGVNYYCIAAHTNQAPPNASFWYAMPAGIYEIPSPYAEVHLFDLHFEQSQDVISITHPNYAPRQLKRLGATNWTLTPEVFVSELAAPTGVTAVATTGTGTTTYRYRVSAVNDTGLEESLPSADASVNNNLLTSGNKNTVSWTAVTGAARYNVYKQSNGLYGYIGQTDALSFVDENIESDVARTPPIQRNPFVSANNYPQAVTYFEQRKVFGGTIAQLQNLWFTRSGTESNLSYSIPSRDSDGIAFRIAARDNNAIRHLVPMGSLLVLTSSAEWRVTSVNTDELTPTSISVRPQAYVGASNVRPQVFNNNVLYVAARGGHVREMGFSNDDGGYITGDLSVRATHLFEDFDITSSAASKAPYPILWVTSSNGGLLGLTYMPEQQVASWHRHDSYTLAGKSSIESVCAVAEGRDDVLYLVVRREIDGEVVRYIETLRDRRFATLQDAFFVDCGLTYNGAPATTISGLTHLVGETVNILADGCVHRQLTVANDGTVVLDQPASVVHVGLPIEADVQTLPVYLPVVAYAQGLTKNVNRVLLKVEESSGIFAGPTFDDADLKEAKQRTTEPYGSPPSLKSEEIEIVLTPTWAQYGQVCLRQKDPLPLTLVSMTAEVSIGG